MTHSEKEEFNEFLEQFGEKAAQELLNEWYPNPEDTAVETPVDLGYGAKIVIHSNTEFGDIPRFELTVDDMIVDLAPVEGIDGEWFVAIGNPHSVHELKVYESGHMEGHET